MRWKRKTGRDWHLWFAWFPVKVTDGWVWLEYVERKVDQYGPASTCYFDTYYQKVGAK